MYFLHTNFAIKQQTGNLTISKIDKIKEHFNEIFPEITQNNESTLVLKNSVVTLVIDSEQITYSIKGDESDINIDVISDYLLNINNMLELPATAPIFIRLQGLENSTDNTHMKSIVPLSNYIDSSDLTGIGYRLIINNENSYGNVHVEPFLRDNKKVYINIDLNTREIKNLENLSTELNILYTFGLEKAKHAAEGLFSI